MSNTGPIGNFIQKTSKNWDLALLYPKLWGVSFNSFDNNLIDNISKVLSKYGDIHGFNQSMLLYSPYKNIMSPNSAVEPLTFNLGNNKYFLLATKLSLPSVNISQVMSTAPTNYANNGLLWGRIVGGITNEYNNNLNISFLDTNKDLYDYLIKPWITAISHQGLIYDENLPSLRCDIYADFYSKNSPEGKGEVKEETILHSYPHKLYDQSFRWASQSTSKKVSKWSDEKPYLRKSILFKNCFPIGIPRKNFNYSKDIGGDEVITDITFGFDYYVISEANGDNLPMADARPGSIFDNPQGSENPWKDVINTV